MSGPAWLGIGAQRCGTTWLVDLLCQHPKVDVPGNKELHRLYRGLTDLWDDDHTLRYQRLFDHEDDTMRIGELTPFYLRAPWTADVAARVLPEDAPVIVILRDPIARFESAVKYQLLRRRDAEGGKPDARWIRRVSPDAIWGGMYAAQLEVWESVLGASRLTVLQYEQVVDAPQETINGLWAQMGLDPVELTGIEERSRTSTPEGYWALDDVNGLREHLRDIYRPDVQRLERRGIDIGRWSKHWL